MEEDAVTKDMWLYLMAGVLIVHGLGHSGRALVLRPFLAVAQAQ